MAQMRKGYQGTPTRAKGGTKIMKWAPTVSGKGLFGPRGKGIPSRGEPIFSESDREAKDRLLGP